MGAIKRYFRSPSAVIGLLLLFVVIAMAISAGWLYPRNPLALAGRPLIWPLSNPRFLLGTDNSGRDIAAQIFYGARLSLLIGGAATAIAIAIGFLIGGFAGFYGGFIDNVLMRITEAFQTLPNFVLLLVLVAVFGSTLTTVTIAVGVVSWPAPARLTRAEFLSLRNREFVQAGRTLGMKDVQLILGEILPNALSDVSLSIEPDEILCVVGESGSGKSMMANAIMRLLPNDVTIDGGRVMFEGKDLASATVAEMRQVRGAGIAMIFQEPMTALNPLPPLATRSPRWFRSHPVYPRPGLRARGWRFSPTSASP